MENNVENIIENTILLIKNYYTGLQRILEKYFPEDANFNIFETISQARSSEEISDLLHRQFNAIHKLTEYENNKFKKDLTELAKDFVIQTGRLQVGLEKIQDGRITPDIKNKLNNHIEMLINDTHIKYVTVVANINTYEDKISESSLNQIESNMNTAKTFAHSSANIIEITNSKNITNINDKHIEQLRDIKSYKEQKL